MPHLTLEYSGNLRFDNPPALLLKLNQALVQSGQFGEIEIKSRALRQDDFVVGTHPEGRAYLHAKLALLQGRDPDTKTALAQSLLDVLKQHWTGYDAHALQLCVEIQEIERPSYARHDIG